MEASIADPTPRIDAATMDTSTMKLLAFDYDLHGHQIDHRVVDLDSRQLRPHQIADLQIGLGITSINRRGRTDYQLEDAASHRPVGWGAIWMKALKGEVQ